MNATTATVLALFIAIPNLALASTAPNLNPAKTFVAELNSQILSVLKADADDDAKYKEVCELVTRYSDITKMANESLGKHRRTFPAEMYPAFYSSYQSMLATLLSAAFDRMRQAKITIQDQVTGTSEEQVVTALVEITNRSPTRLQFFLAPNEDTGFKLVDAAMLGTRLIMSKRTAFDSTLSNQTSGPVQAAQALINSLNEANRPCEGSEHLASAKD